MERQPISKMERLIKPLFTGTEVVLGTGALASMLTGQPIMTLGFATLNFFILAGHYERISYLRTRRILEDANERVSRNTERSKETLQRIRERSVASQAIFQDIEKSHKAFEESSRRIEAILAASRVSAQELQAKNALLKDSIQ